jgi:hypothetical protein
MNTVFDFCVELLLDVAAITGMTYKEVNVWIFCIFWPVIIIVLCVNNIILRRKLRAIQKHTTH